MTSGLVSDLTVLEALVGMAFLVFLGWVIWTSRKTKRFRAGIFVERNHKEKEEE